MEHVNGQTTPLWNKGWSSLPLNTFGSYQIEIFLACSRTLGCFWDVSSYPGSLFELGKSSRKTFLWSLVCKPILRSDSVFDPKFLFKNYFLGNKTKMKISSALYSTKENVSTRYCVRNYLLKVRWKEWENAAIVIFFHSRATLIFYLSFFFLYLCR